jgi:hypothetical protein
VVDVLQANKNSRVEQGQLQDDIVRALGTYGQRNATTTTSPANVAFQIIQQFSMITRSVGNYDIPVNGVI